MQDRTRRRLVELLFPELDQDFATDAELAAAIAAATVAAPSSDAAREAYVPSRLSAAALRSAFRAPIDSGGSLAAKLDLGIDDMSVGLAGDSTGNENVEWFRRALDVLAGRFPSMRFEQNLWNDTTQAMGNTVAQAGALAPLTTVSDTFTRTAADVIGTAPESGGTWGGDAVNANGDWSLNGSKLVRTSDATASVIVSDGGTQGDIVLTAESVTLDTTAGAANKTFRLYGKYLSTATHLYAELGVLIAGTRQVKLVAKINGTVTQVGVSVNNPTQLPAGAATTVTVVLQVTGLTAVIKLNGTAVLTQALTQAQADALAAGTGVGLTSTAFPGMTVDGVTLVVTPTAATIRTLTAWNGSVPGSTLTYQQDRLAAMFPQPLDVLFVSSCHNYVSSSTAQYLAAVESFVAAFTAVHPEAGVVVCSQNPKKPPATGAQSHVTKLSALRALAQRRGWGYLPVLEAFQVKTGGGASLVKADGIHPTTSTDDPVSNGSDLWRDVAVSYLDKRSLRPAA